MASSFFDDQAGHSDDDEEEEAMCSQSDLGDFIVEDGEEGEVAVEDLQTFFAAHPYQTIIAALQAFDAAWAAEDPPSVIDGHYRTLVSFLSVLVERAKQVGEDNDEFHFVVRLFWAVLCTVVLGYKDPSRNIHAGIPRRLWYDMTQLEHHQEDLLMCIDSSGDRLWGTDAIFYGFTVLKDYISLGLSMLNVCDLLAVDGEEMVANYDRESDGFGRISLMSPVDEHKKMRDFSSLWELSLQSEIAGWGVIQSTGNGDEKPVDIVHDLLGRMRTEMGVKRVLNLTYLRAYVHGYRVRDGHVYQKLTRKVKHLLKNENHQAVCGEPGCQLTKEQHNCLFPRVKHAFCQTYIERDGDGLQKTNGWVRARVRPNAPSRFSNMMQFVHSCCDGCMTVTHSEAKEAANTIIHCEENRFLPHLTTSRFKWSFLNGDLVLCRPHGFARMQFFPYQKNCICEELKQQAYEHFHLVCGGRCHCLGTAKHPYDPDENAKASTKVYDTYFDAVEFMKTQWGAVSDSVPFENAVPLTDAGGTPICAHCGKDEATCDSQREHAFFPWRLDPMKSSRALMRCCPFYTQKWKDQGYMSEEEIQFILMLTMGKTNFKMNECERWECMLNIYGKGGTGKSMELNLIKQTLPHSECKMLAPKDQADFAVGNLFKKDEMQYRVVIGQDVSNAVLNAIPREVLTSMVSGEVVTAAQKFEKQISVIWEPSIILVSNEALGIHHDQGTSLYRRMVFVNMQHQVVPDELLKDRLAVEHPFLLAAAIDTYLAHARSKESFWDRILPPRFKHIREKTWKMSCPFTNFFDSVDADTMIPHPQGYVQWTKFKDLLRPYLPRQKNEYSSDEDLIAKATKYGLRVVEDDLPIPGRPNKNLRTKWVHGICEPFSMLDEWGEAPDSATFTSSPSDHTPITTQDELMKMFIRNFATTFSLTEREAKQQMGAYLGIEGTSGTVVPGPSPAFAPASKRPRTEYSQEFDQGYDQDPYSM